MDANRVQEYLDLIQALLKCPSREHEQILNANPDLLDGGLVEVMKLSVEVLEQSGNEDAANFLINITHQLVEALNSSSPTPTSFPLLNSNSQLDFLMQVLRITNESNGNSQILYPLLQGNLDKLDDNFATVLRSWATAKLSEVDSNLAQAIVGDIFYFTSLIKELPLGSIASNLEIAIVGNEVAATVFTRKAFPHDWAMTQHNLGNAYCDRIRGDKAENLEVAICYYTQVLQVHTREAFPFDWAMTQYSLGNACRRRIQGDKAENLETAIRYLTQALQVFTREAFSHNWATTQNSLGNVYCQRIKDDKAENLEAAICYYNQALQVFTREAFPFDWAMTQHNLGNAYCNRIQGDKAENLEVAICYYNQALQVRTCEAFPYNWADIQTNLGNAYYQRIEDSKAENLEVAIRYYTQALQVRTREAFPFDWAEIQHNLAAVYSNRIKGDKAENLEVAIRYYTQALQVRTRESFPHDWAMTQNNLGETYRQRIRGEKAENLETAIHYLTQALQVYTREVFPFDWAMTQHNLGIAYGDRIQGEEAENLEAAIRCLTQALQVRTREAFPEYWAKTQRSLASVYGNQGNKAENLETAICYYTQALQVFTREAFPFDWAMTQNNLGINYRQRVCGDKTENLEAAIRYLQNALEIRTRDTMPQNYAETLFILGLAYQDNKQQFLAYDTFATAIETVESLRDEVVSGDETKQKLAEEWSSLYNCMVEICLELSNITQAMEYAERSKTRNLVEQILSRDLRTIFSSDVITQLEIYRDEIATGQYQIQNGKAENAQVLAQHLQELRQQRNELQNHYLPVGYGFKFDSFQATLDKYTVVIEWYILYDKILAFIVTSTKEVTVWQSQPKDREALEDWVSQYLQNYYYQKDQWQNSLGRQLKKLASILHIDEILIHIPDHCNQLILIPHRFLHLFPLNALPVSQNYQESPCLLDLFAGGVSYAPSCQLLQQVQKRQRPDFQSLFAIQNPTEDLSYTDLEVQVIQNYFNTSNVLKKTPVAKLTRVAEIQD